MHLQGQEGWRSGEALLPVRKIVVRSSEKKPELLMKVIYDAVALYRLSIHSYLTSTAFRSELLCQCSSNEASLSLCLHVT